MSPVKIEMPIPCVKVVLGSLHIIVRVLLKIKNIPEADRAELEQAKSLLDIEISGFKKAESKVDADLDGLPSVVREILKIMKG